MKELIQKVWGDHRWRSIIQVLLIIMLAIINPLGMRSATDQQSRDIYNKVTASLYDNAGQDEIAVILIDETTLRTLGLNYPPSFDLYRSLQESVFVAGGKAVFFDIAFLDRRGDQASLDAFATSLNMLPVVLSHTEEARRNRECAGTKRNNLPELAQNAAYEAHVAIANASSHVPLFAKDSCLPTGWRTSATAKLYELWCQDQHNCAQITPDMPELVVWWGDTYPHNFAAIHPSLTATARHCPQHNNNWGRVLRTAIRQLFYFDNNHPGQLSPDCSYHPVIKAEWLIDPDATGADRHILQETLANRMVLIGADFAAMQDFGTSPVFSDIPGVMVHAMALDNLMTHHDRYLRPWPDGIGPLSLSDILEIAFLIGFEAIGFWFCRKLVQRHKKADRGELQVVMFRATITTMVVAVCVGFGTTLFCTEILLFEPINWTGIMAACCVMAYPMFDELLRFQPDTSKKPSTDTNTVKDTDHQPEHSGS